MRRAEVNVVGLNELAVSHNKSPLMVDCTQMDCTNLPFRDLTIDTVASDLPFGKRFNEKMLGVSNRYKCLKKKKITFVWHFNKNYIT